VDLIRSATVIDKAALKTELVAALTASLEMTRAAHAAALEGATHTESRAENDKDTRGLEQSYLARGQAQRVAELETALLRVTTLHPRTFHDDDAIGVGALVTVADDPLLMLVAPDGGGVCCSPPAKCKS